MWGDHVACEKISQDSLRSAWGTEWDEASLAASPTHATAFHVSLLPTCCYSGPGYHHGFLLSLQRVLANSILLSILSHTAVFLKCKSNHTSPLLKHSHGFQSPSALNPNSFAKLRRPLVILPLSPLLSPTALSCHTHCSVSSAQVASPSPSGFTRFRW
jgi:hypothetical protein